MSMTGQVLKEDEQPNFIIDYDDDKNPKKVTIVINLEMVETHPNGTIFFRGFWEETKTEILKVVLTLRSRRQNTSKVLLPH